MEKKGDYLNIQDWRQKPRKTMRPACFYSARNRIFMSAVCFSLVAVALSSCATKSYIADQFEEAVIIPPPSVYTITGHRDAPAQIPLWLRQYLDGDEQLVEALPDYSGDYVFVVTEKGAKLTGLEKWSGYFRIEQDFSHAVFLRMYSRLIAESNGRPDYYLGDFFETFLKKIAGHLFEGAVRESDYWIKVMFERESALSGISDPGENTEEADAVEIIEEYRFYILVKISKAAFQKEIMDLFSAASAEAQLDRSRSGAVARLQNTLLTGF
jgi:hypothetical protein